MKRRDFIGGLGGGIIAWALGARAEISTKRPLIAVLSTLTKKDNSPAYYSALITTTTAPWFWIVTGPARAVSIDIPELSWRPCPISFSTSSIA